MCHFALDIGNTRIKLGHFESQHLGIVKSFISVNEVIDYVLTHKPKELFISSVSAEKSKVLAEGLQDRLPIRFLNDQVGLPFESYYQTPATLGKDRIAAVMGAKSLFPDLSLLIIDAGTCITFDYIDKSGAYHGGSISPGLEMRIKSMHEFTSTLPLVDLGAQKNINVVGNSTEACLQSGAVNGCLYEMAGFIAYHRKKQGDIKVLICGGDANRFLRQLKEEVTHVPDLVLIGTNELFLQEHRKKFG